MIFEIINDDCINAMQAMDPDSIDSVVCDPPYGLSFMGKSWDHAVPGVEYWVEALRVLKPGGHLVAFGGTRLYHRLACAIEDAGFEVRDCLSWVYGTGFPKSLDVSKAIDKAAGAERAKVEHKARPESSGTFSGASDTRPWIEESRKKGKHETAGNVPITPEALKWQGFGTNLKPAQEFICLARKPFKCTVAANVLEHGTGALNIDGCRVGSEGGGTHCTNRDADGKCRGHKNAGRSTSGETIHGPATSAVQGRWPANLVHDGSDEVLEIFPKSKSGSRKEGVRKGMGYHGADGDGGPEIKASKGSASRFFYCAKSPKSERWVNLTCDCQTVKLEEWENEGQNQKETIAATSLRPGISEGTSRGDLGSSIASSGSSRTGQSPVDTTSTTSTGTDSTTELKTSNSSMQPSTNESIQDAKNGMEYGLNHAASAESSNPSTLITGISQGRVGLFTGGVVPATSAESLKKKSCENCGAKFKVESHPTQKPIALMAWLCRMVTPPEGTILDPFAGSGSTIVAAIREGFSGIGIEMEEQFADIAQRRCEHEEW